MRTRRRAQIVLDLAKERQPFRYAMSESMATTERYQAGDLSIDAGTRQVFDPGAGKAVAVPLYWRPDLAAGDALRVAAWRGPEAEWMAEVANSSSITKARKRIGWQVMEDVFRSSVEPVADAASGETWQGLAPVAQPGVRVADGRNPHRIVGAQFGLLEVGERFPVHSFAGTRRAPNQNANPPVGKVSAKLNKPIPMPSRYALTSPTTAKGTEKTRVAPAAFIEELTSAISMRRADCAPTAALHS